MWRVAAATSVGTSHRQDGTPCQDAFHVAELPLPLGKPALMAFVADGAGSVSASEIGARRAVDAAAGFARRHGEVIGATFDAAFVQALIVHVRETLVAEATSRGIGVRELACTILGALAFRDKTLLFQLGDGAIVFDSGTGLELAITPMGGEYVNMTHFLVDDRALERTAIRTVGAVTRLALFSDGIQRLALNLSSGVPHGPFFAPFFATLESAPPDQRAALDAALQRFLDSDQVNARTDDDKTLVLAVHRR